MRALRLAAPPMLLLAFASCKPSSQAATQEAGAAAPSGAAAASSSGPGDGASRAAPAASARPLGSAMIASLLLDSGLFQGKPAVAVPGQEGRYYIDSDRFSAVYPEAPLVKLLPPTRTAVEAHTVRGTVFVAICSPLNKTGDGKEFERAHDQSAADGEVLADSHPPFPGGEAYEVRSRLKEGGERVMRFVKAAGRICSVGAEMNAPGDEKAVANFIESFRREPGAG